MTPKSINLFPKKLRTTQPAPCWIWPGPFRNNFPIHRTKTGTASVTKTLVEHVNGPIPVHPYTHKPMFFVRRCELNEHCVNPYHARVFRKTDLFELPADYLQIRFYFTHELKDMDPSLVQYLREQGLVAQDHAHAQSPLPQ